MTHTPTRWVVEVADQSDAHLAGVSACWNYSSPPQPLDQALSLVAVLLGGPPELPRAEDSRWRGNRWRPP